MKKETLEAASPKFWTVVAAANVGKVQGFFGVGIRINLIEMPFSFTVRIVCHVSADICRSG
jgi:hypothetical protein